MRRILLLTIAFLLLSTPSYSTSSRNAGTRAGTVLRQSRTAHQTAIGGAVAASRNGVEGMWGNPSSLVEIARREISLTRVQSFANITSNMMAYGQRAGEHLALGISYTSVDYGSIQGRDISRRSTGEVKTGDDVGAISFGFSLKPEIAIGATVRYMSERLGSYGDQTFTSDIGVLYQTPIKRLRIGAVAQNLGGSLKFVSESFRLARTFRLGAQVSFFDDRFLLALDAAKPSDGDWEGSFGFEAEGTKFLVLRAGGTARRYEKFEPSFGLGIQTGSFSLDYSWIPKLDSIDDQHRITLNVKM